MSAPILHFTGDISQDDKERKTERKTNARPKDWKNGNKNCHSEMT